MCSMELTPRKNFASDSCNVWNMSVESKIVLLDVSWKVSFAQFLSPRPILLAGHVACLLRCHECAVRHVLNTACPSPRLLALVHKKRAFSAPAMPAIIKHIQGRGKGRKGAKLGRRRGVPQRLWDSVVASTTGSSAPTQGGQSDTGLLEPPLAQNSQLRFKESHCEVGAFPGGRR